VNVLSASVADLFRSTDWITGSSQDFGEFVQFTVAPVAGYSLNLTDITFDVQRSVDKASAGEKDGPLNGQVQIYQGPGLNSLGLQNFGLGGGIQSVLFDFVDFTTQAGETVTVRFYGWNAVHRNGWLDLDNVTINGSSSPVIVPEPSSASFMLVGFLMFLLHSLIRGR